MPYTRMIKGKRSPLTFKVVIQRELWWEAHVFEPYSRRRLWGLLPDALAYRWVYNEPRGPLDTHLQPAQVEAFAEHVVEQYERHKLAWEAHDATTRNVSAANCSQLKHPPWPR